MKNFLRISSIAICLITITFTSNLIAEGGDPSDQGTEKKAEWLQYSKSSKKAVSSAINIDAEGEVVEGIVVGGVKVGTKLLFVRCCKPVRNKESWCDMALQDKSC